MTLDAEANLTIAAGRGAVARRKAIARFRNRLLSEHLDTEVDAVEARLDETKSLIRTIDELATSERTLARLSSEYPERIEKVAPSSSISDPERPLDSGTIAEAVLPRRAAESRDHPLLKTVAGALVLSALLLWRFWPRETN